MYPINLYSSFPCAGVEHLLRDVKDTTISTLATEVPFAHSCYTLIPFELVLLSRL